MPDTNDNVIGSTSDSSEDLALLNQEDEGLETKGREEGRQVPPPEPKEKDEEKDEQEKDEESPKEEKEEEPKEDKPPYDRPTMQQLREEFPDLFKKFPSLRDIYYREQEFSQIFSTVEDAKEAAANAQSFDGLSDKILSGDTSGLLAAVKDADDAAFAKLAGSILPSLYQLSPDAHWHATLPLMQNLVRGFYVEGQRRRDDNVMNAAEYLSDFIFGDIAIAKGERDVVPKKAEPTEEMRRFEQERAKFAVDRFEGFHNSVKHSADEQLAQFVANKKMLDPDGVFSDFIKETIVGKVVQEVDKQLVSDKAHMRYMNSLWDKAKTNGFSDEWKSRILSAYLARAKSLVPSVRAKFVSEAQGGAARASAKKNEINEKVGSRREPGSGRYAKDNANGTLDAKRIDWNRTSDMDLLEDRITYRNK